jgi:isocitrate dehydrogenase kinase/phosphatase
MRRMTSAGVTPSLRQAATQCERYQFVFRHDRAGRLVDAQEFKRLRLTVSIIV